MYTEFINDNKENKKNKGYTIHWINEVHIYHFHFYVFSHTKKITFLFKNNFV